MGITIKGGDDFRKKLNEIIEKYPDVMDMALDDTADAISLEAQTIVPVDTGRLRGSINVKREYLKKTIGTNVEYARHVEYGTSPHEIVAKNKKVLANKKKGIFFGKKVNHTGSKEQPFLRPALEKFGTTATIVKYFKENL